jgi:hypothetical protein
MRFVPLRNWQIFLWEFKIIRVLCNYLSLLNAPVEDGQERLKHAGGLPHIVYFFV